MSNETEIKAPEAAEVPLSRSFPEVIDNTCRSSFRKCEKYWEYANINRIKPATTSIHLHAGAAFAKGIEMTRKAFYAEKRSAEESLAIGVEALIKAYGDFETHEDSPKSCERMVRGLISYFDNYQLEHDYIKPFFSPESNNYGIEFSFAIPIERADGSPILHPDTGNPLLYAGRFDMLGEADREQFPSPAGCGALFVCDEKTTSQLGDSWRKQWSLDSQFTGYCWAAKSFGFNVAGAVIRGISFLKNGNGHAEALIYRPEWQIARWHAELVRDVDRMIESYKSGGETTSMALDKGICGNYGGCAYGLLCESPNPDNWIPLHYAKNTWNPLHKEE